MVRILIADAYEVVRTGLQRIVETQSSWEVVAVAGDGKEAIQKAIETKPDVAVIGYRLPLINGIEVTRQIRARLPKTEVLTFTAHDDEAVITQLLQAGARGFLFKSDANGELIAAIEALASHKPFFTTKVSEALLRSFTVPTEHGGRAHISRAPNRPRDRRGLQQQGDCQLVQHQREDRWRPTEQRSCANSSSHPLRLLCATLSATGS